ncbi:MAG TPA: protein ImuA [Allosphingosinicella sp.]|nr:protein ImuA [Allosphingosinicella sp.]
MPVEARIAALRAEIAALAESARGGARLCLPFGIEAIDRRLAGGGLAVDALHEIAGAAPGLGNDAAATLFAAAVAARRAGAEGTVLWAFSRRDLFAPGLAQAGLAPDRLLYAECRRDEEVLAVMEEGLRHGGLSAVVGEVGRCAMPATRRLQLAAEEGGTMALMLKRWRRSGEDPLAFPSAAITRWRLAPVPSAPLQVPGVGRARWRLDLARQRGGEPFTLIVEAPDEEARLALPAGARRRAPAQAAARRAA